MKLISKILLSCGSFLLVGALAVQAAPYNQRTRITFGEPVVVSNTVLPAGTYVFTIASGMHSRDIVRVWNAQQTKVITTVMAVPDYSYRTPRRAIVELGESPANLPQPVKAWFYPGLKTGLEFVYPMHQTRELARLNGKNAKPAMVQSAISG
jgi:hypothetical protein